MDRTINKIAHYFLMTTVIFWISCSDDSGTSSTSIDITGSWEVASIGSTSVTALNSIWTFNEDGTNNWFLLYGEFDLYSEGDHSVSGNTLTVTGFITNVAGTNKISITVSNNDNTFSWVDSDGDRWVYNRILL